MLSKCVTFKHQNFGRMAKRVSVSPLNIQGNWNMITIDSPENVECIQYSELFDYLLAGCTDGVVRVFDKQKLSNELIEKDMKDKHVAVTGMKHRPVSKNYPVTNCLVCTYTNGLVKNWNYNFSQVTFTLTENRRTNGVSYHPKLAKFVTYGDNTKIYLYDEDTKRQERILSDSDIDGHKGSVVCAVFNPKTGNELLSGALDNTIQFWDIRQPGAVKSIQGVNMIGEGIDFSPTALQFVTCSNEKDKPFRIWDYKQATEIKVIEPDKIKAMLRCGKYLNKENFVCVGVEPNLVRIVDMNTFQTTTTITNFPNTVTGITIGPPDGTPLPKFSVCSGKKIYEFTPK